MREQRKGTALRIRKVNGEEETKPAGAAGIEYDATHDCYYCGGWSYPAEIVMEVVGEMAKIIAIDFDGTLCHDAHPDIGAPRIDVINRVLEEQRRGAKLILNTCREDFLLLAAVKWCKNYGLEFDAVNANLPEMIEKYGGDCRKIFADEYWDDRAVRV